MYRIAHFLLVSSFIVIKNFGRLIFLLYYIKDYFIRSLH